MSSKGLGSIIFGYDLGVIAGVLPAPDFIVCFPLHYRNQLLIHSVQRVMGPRFNDPNLQGLIASIFGM